MFFFLLLESCYILFYRCYVLIILSTCIANEYIFTFLAYSNIIMAFRMRMYCMYACISNVLFLKNFLAHWDCSVEQYWNSGGSARQYSFKQARATAFPPTNTRYNFIRFVQSIKHVKHLNWPRKRFTQTNRGENFLFPFPISGLLSLIYIKQLTSYTLAIYM